MKLAVNYWSMEGQKIDYKAILIRYRKYLEVVGLRKDTIKSYVYCVGNYLSFVSSDRPSQEMALRFIETLHDRKLARSTINNYSFSIKRYHKMLEEEISLPYLQRNNEIPYYFDQEDILKIFAACRNLKHYAMLQVMFYCCLRASEICNLDDKDVDLRSSTLHIRNGKGGKDAIIFLNNDCVEILQRYLTVRPKMEIDARNPLFYTDRGKRWDRGSVHRMFVGYKAKAGIQKSGGVHVFARHSAATLMISNGCDIRIVQKILRHNDIRTTLRYAHVSDKTQREAHQKYLTL